MEKYNLQSEVDGKEVSIEFELKFLSNQLRTKIYNLDADFQKRFNAQFKDSKVSILQKELTTKIKEVEEESTNLSLQQKNIIINQLYLKFVTDLGDEDMIDENSKYTISTWNFNDEKLIKTLQLIVKNGTVTGGLNALIQSPFGSEFWDNCDIEKVGEIVDSFRTRYKIAG